MKRPFPRWFLVTGAVTLLLLLVASVWFLWGPARALLVEPVADAVWLLYNLFESNFPQEDIWVLLILLGGLRLSLLAASKVEMRSTIEPLRLRPGRVGHWLDVLSVGPRARRLFIRPFRFLVIKVVAHREQRPYQETLNRLHNHQLDMPFHLQAYLSVDEGAGGKRAGRGTPEAVPADAPASAAETPIEEILEILETYLEIPHE